MTYSSINDTGYSSYPRHYYICPVCCIKCRRIDRHMRNYHEGITNYPRIEVDNN